MLIRISCTLQLIKLQLLSSPFQPLTYNPNVPCWYMCALMCVLHVRLCLCAPGSPIPYSSLRSYCKQDPAGSWGAYVAGCLLVLAREKGVKYPDGISILICSDVPEGKGVSSSAALEVAVMSAAAAAHSCSLTGRELALLCQKAEVSAVCAHPPPPPQFRG